MFSKRPETRGGFGLSPKGGKAGNVIVPIYGSFSKYTPRGNMEALEIVEPFEELKDAAIGAHINTFPDPDGIVRQALLIIKERR